MNDILRLESERAPSTSLISYFIKSGTNNSSVLLAREMNASENIKDKNTRKAVQTALKSIQNNLKGLTHIPDNGLAVFAGNGLYV